jgi:hypothetical protein
MASHPASPQRTVPRPACTAAPTGFMISDATRSLETAASGWTPKSKTRIGVMSAPPPIPVRSSVTEEVVGVHIDLYVALAGLIVGFAVGALALVWGILILSVKLGDLIGFI